jgi:hypothetical protein
MPSSVLRLFLIAAALLLPAAAFAAGFSVTNATPGDIIVSGIPQSPPYDLVKIVVPARQTRLIVKDARQIERRVQICPRAEYPGGQHCLYTVVPQGLTREYKLIVGKDKNGDFVFTQ